MKSIYLIFLASAASLFAKESLPKKSQELLKQYDEYQEKKVKALNDDLLKVKKQVVAALKKHLQDASKKSDLDASQALIAEIKKWESEVKEMETSTNSKLPIKKARKIGSTTKSFRFDGDGKHWLNTKMRVEKGQTVTVKVTGEIGLSKAHKTAVSDGNGISLKQFGLDNSFNLGVLLARLSSDNSKIYKLGQSSEMTAEKTGTLELTVNDAFLGDNTGHWDIEVTVK